MIRLINHLDPTVRPSLTPWSPVLIYSFNHIGGQGRQGQALSHNLLSELFIWDSKLYTAMLQHRHTLQHKMAIIWGRGIPKCKINTTWSELVDLLYTHLQIWFSGESLGRLIMHLNIRKHRPPRGNQTSLHDCFIVIETFRSRGFDHYTPVTLPTQLFDKNVLLYLYDTQLPPGLAGQSKINRSSRKAIVYAP